MQKEQTTTIEKKIVTTSKELLALLVFLFGTLPAIGYFIFQVKQTHDDQAKLIKKTDEFQKKFEIMNDTDHDLLLEIRILNKNLEIATKDIEQLKENVTRR